MTQQGEGREGGLRFLDGLARLFHGRAEKPAAAPPAEAPGDGEPALGPVETEFEAALRALHATIERAARQPARARRGHGRRPGRSPGPAEAAHGGGAPRDPRGRRREARRARDRDRRGRPRRTAAFLGELETFAAAGRGSHKIFPRVRYAIVERLWRVNASAAAR
jgi:hypothetical protein